MYIGIDIGGTKIAVTEGKGDNIIRKEVFPTASASSWREALDRAAGIASGFSGNAIGISAGGPLDSRKGMILSPPNLPGWDDVPAVSYLSDKLGKPAFLLNDADAGALAEYRYGAGKGYESIVFCTFGTGMGAGLILGGRLWRGRSDGAGEIGHIRLSGNGPAGYGKMGSSEGWASGGGIAMLGFIVANEFQQKGRKPYWFNGSIPTAKTIIEEAAKGDEAASKTIRLSAEKLGSIMAFIMDAYNPDAVILGSLFIRAENLFRPEMERVIAEEALARNICPVIKAGLGEKIGDTAALTVAEEGMNGNL